jgi:hypothetical protein
MIKKRSFKTKTFSRWMKKTGLRDASLLLAINEMENGLIDADLGGNVFKKRVAFLGAGKRSVARVLVASKVSGKWFFLFGFGKNERENIGNDELIQLQGTARLLLHLSETDIEKLLLIGELKELGNHDK